MYRIIEHADGDFTLANEQGSLARTNDDGKVFVTNNRAWAEEAMAYLNQTVKGLTKQRGSHRAKSTFGI